MSVTSSATARPKPPASRGPMVTAHLIRGVLLVLLGDIVERAAEAGGVTSSEEMLGRRGPRLSRPAHFLRHRKLNMDHAVVGAGVAVATAGRRGASGVKGLD